MRKTFKVGDTVIWQSQAKGSWITKKGVIERVVPAGQMPHMAGSGYPRDHETYVVAVEIGKRVKRLKYYWPRVSALEAAHA